MQIRPAGVTDAEALTDLHLAAWEQAYGGLIPAEILAERRRRRTERIARWRDNLAHGAGRTLLAWEGERLVGFVTTGPARDEGRDQLPELEVWALYVHADVYGAGVGHALLTAAIGAAASYLWVLAGNERAISFYRGQGFDFDGAERCDEHGVERRMVRRRRRAAAVPAITLQFHPDWPHAQGRVIDSMVADGCYRSQFVTGISNGGLTAFRGGDRWRWESRLFDGRYDERPPGERPVYGAWNRRADPYGGAIRFGSSYVRLRAEAVTRATFCFPDSVFEPEDVGDAAQLATLCQMADESGLDDLDECVEAHVHGPIRFATDVAAVVLDPCFAETAVADAAERLGCQVEFHPGFRAAPETFDPEYRGAHIVELAKALGDELTPRTIGDAARSGVHPPQAVKQVWHCLARFGRGRG